MANLDSLYAKKYVLMPAVRTSRRKIFVFEFIYCTNVPPYSSYASTLLTTAASECKKDARHNLAILRRTVDGGKGAGLRSVSCPQSPHSAQGARMICPAGSAKGCGSVATIRQGLRGHQNSKVARWQRYHRNSSASACRFLWHSRASPCPRHWTRGGVLYSRCQTLWDFTELHCC